MHTNKKQSINMVSNASIIVMTAIILLAISLFISIVHYVPLLDSVKFYAAVFFLLYMPGYAILNLLKWDDDPLAYTILSLLTGVAVAPIIYSFVRIIEQPWLLLLLSAVSLFFFIIKNRVLSKQLILISKNYHLEKIWWLGLLSCSLILILLSVSHFNDLKIMFEKGYLLRSHAATESIFHLGIINAVKTSVTPSFPYLSGYNLSYHLDMHLLAEMFNRYTGISSILIVYYFSPLLYFILIVSVPAVFFYQLSNNILYSILFGFSMFAGDLSFLSQLFGFPSDSSFPIVFTAPTWSLFTLNGIIPAIPLLFGSVIMLDRFFKEDRWKYLLLFCLFVVASFRVKSSMGPHILGAVAISLAFIVFQKQYKYCWKMGVATIISSLIIIVTYFSRVLPTESLRIIEFKPFNGFLSAVHRMGLNIAEYQLSEQPIYWVTFFVLGFALYLVGSFGVRVVFVKSVFDLFSAKITQPTTVFILIFIVSGFFLSEMAFIGVKGSAINNGGWFAIQSLYLSGYFIITLLASIEDTVKRRLLTVLVIIFSFAGTLSFLEFRNYNGYIKITPEQLDLSRFIEKSTPKGSVIIEPLQYAPSIVSHFSGRHSLIAIYVTFISHAASKSVIDERLEAIEEFYDQEFEGDRRAKLQKFNIDYIVLRMPQKKYFQQLDLGRIVFENIDYLLIKVNKEL